MKCCDGNTLKDKQRVYFENGKVRVAVSLYESTCNTDQAVWYCRTLNDLLVVAQTLYDENLSLRKENARICKRPTRPKLKPSKISNNDSNYKKKIKRQTIAQNPKKKNLTVDEVIKIKAPSQPQSAKFKGYQRFTVQDIEIRPVIRQYCRERWQLKNGNMYTAPLPKEISNQHFGPKLRQYILYQYYHQRVTQPLLLNQLREWGISISSGQLSNLITKNKEQWHLEKKEILTIGLKYSNYIQVDDTSAKHEKENYYCTHIGNENFAFFETKAKKSRINFLSLLQGDNIGFCLNETAIEHLSKYTKVLNWISGLFLREAVNIGYYSNYTDWKNLLSTSTFNENHHKATTEAAMIGYLLYSQRIKANLVILSDSAGQFKLQRNAACWVHVERILTSVIPENEIIAQSKERKLKQFWLLYRYIKAKNHKASSNKNIKKRIDYLYGKMCELPMKKSKLNKPLKQLARLKDSLLISLNRPEVPLHNNQSESDIREFVIRRIVSGSTRSNDGLMCRDTFTTLKKTAQRHQISFWDLIGDRLFKAGKVPQLSAIIQQSLLG